MQQPFEKQQVRNFFLFYGGVILLMLLFYLLTSLFHAPSQHPQKVFGGDRNATEKTVPSEGEVLHRGESTPFRLLPPRQ